MSRQNWILLVLVFALVWSIGPGGRAGAEDGKASLLSDASKAWSSLKDFSEHLEGQFTETVTFSDSSMPSSKSVTQFLISNGNVRFEIQKGKDKAVIAGAFNPSYFFLLNGETGAGFQVAQIQPSTVRVPTSPHTPAAYVLEYVYAPWFFMQKPLAAWLKDPDFVVKKVTSHPQDGRMLLRAEFTYVPKKASGDVPLKMLTFYEPSWVILDPDNYWTIQEHLITTWYGNQRGRVTYGERVGGFPMAKRAERISTGARTKDVKTTRWEIDRIAHRMIPESEFTLSAFGLPEPSFGPRRFGNWPILLALAAVFAALAVTLRRVLRRREAQA